MDVFIYELRRISDNTLLSYGTKDDNVLQADQAVVPLAYPIGEGQTAAEVRAAAISDYAARFVLSRDKPSITADGADEATVTITTNLPVSSISLTFTLLNPQTRQPIAAPAVQVVSIASGTGSQAFTADNPCLILIEPTDRTQYFGSVIVEAKAP